MIDELYKYREAITRARASLRGRSKHRRQSDAELPRMWDWPTVLQLVFLIMLGLITSKN